MGRVVKQRFETSNERVDMKTGDKKTAWFVVRTVKNSYGQDEEEIVGPRIGKWSACILLAVFGLVILGFGWSTVSPGHRGVAVTLGSVDQTFRGEGFTLKLPILTRIVEVSVQQQTQATHASCFSADLQAVDVAVTVLYRIPEGKVVELYQQYKGDPFPSLIDPRLQEALKAVTANYTADKLVKSREKIKVETMEHVKVAVGDMVQIVDINIANIDLSDQLEKAIESKMVQEQESLAMTFKLDKAKKDAEIQIVEAKAEAESVRIKGEALKQSPDVIQLEIVKKWNGVAPTSVVTSEKGAGILLPLK